MAKWAIYRTDLGTASARPVYGIIELADEPADTLTARLAEQTALLGGSEAVIQLLDSAEFYDVDDDANTYDFTVDSTATPPVALTSVTVARFTLEQKHAAVRRRRDTELANGLQYLAADRVLTETDLGTVETYLAALRAISDTEAAPDSVVWPTLGALANNASATLKARSYRRGNILAAVTQSSGVPTGGLIEWAENSNGIYVRLADGLQLCFGIKKATYVSGAQLLLGWTFPAAFADEEQIWVNGFMSTTNPAGTTDGLPIADMEGCQVLGTARSTTRANFQVRSVPYTFLSGDEVWLNVMAVGRWI